MKLHRSLLLLVMMAACQLSMIGCENCGGGVTIEYVPGEGWVARANGSCSTLAVPRDPLLTRSALPPTSLNAAASQTFRLTSLLIRDPHFFVDVGPCIDVTGAINDDIAQRLSTDQDEDGHLDANALLILGNLDPSNPGGGLLLMSANCDTLAVTSCVPDEDPELFVPIDYANNIGNPCLSPDPGTLHHPTPYFPPVATPSQQCFSTSSFDLTFEIGDASLPMEACRIAATYVGDPPTALIHGLMLGFLSESSAESFILPSEISLIGGLPLSATLPGGEGNCSSADDRDVGPDGTTLGWWVYANFEATKVTNTAVTAPTVELPKASVLQAWPNPVGAPGAQSPSVNLAYACSADGRVRIEVLDVQGRRLRVLVDDWRSKGTDYVHWDTRDEGGRFVPGGVYFVRLETASTTETRKLQVVR